MRYVFTIVVLASLVGPAGAADREYWIGVHDFNVPDVDSHTYGITVGAIFDKQTRSGRHLIGGIDLFADRDKDDLDPDHIPIRWDVHLGTDGAFWKGTHTQIAWSADVNTRMNTVSSIEREITALPSIVASYNGNIFQPSQKAGAGWFFLEIDDDVPKTRGYDRSDFRNSTFAYLVAADLKIKIGTCCEISGEAQRWQDSDDWLQTQYQAALVVATGDWIKGGKFMLTADFYEYNLDPYQRPGEPTILPWDNDVLVRLILKTAR